MPNLQRKENFFYFFCDFFFKILLMRMSNIDLLNISQGSCLNCTCPKYQKPDKENNCLACQCKLIFHQKLEYKNCSFSIAKNQYLWEIVNLWIIVEKFMQMRTNLQKRFLSWIRLKWVVVYLQSKKTSWYDSQMRIS